MKSNVLTYKGYYGSVAFSLEDNCLFGSLIGLENGAMTYEGSNLDELKNIPKSTSHPNNHPILWILWSL